MPAAAHWRRAAMAACLAAGGAAAHPAASPGCGAGAAGAELRARLAHVDDDRRSALRALLATADDLEAQGLSDACAAILDAVRALSMTAPGPADADARAAGGSLGRPGPESGSGDGAARPAGSSVETAGVGQPDGASQDGAASGAASPQGPELGIVPPGEARKRAEELAAPPRGEKAPWQKYDYTESAKRAEPFDTLIGEIDPARIVDAEVRTNTGEELGEVEGYLLSEGRLTDVIVGYGGLLGIAERDVAMAPRELRYDREDGVFFTGVGEAELDTRPDWDQERLDDNPEFWIRDD